VAVLTNAGGPGVTAADALESHGLNLAALSPETEAALRAILPADASVRNPVDMLAAATAGQYVESLRILLDDPGVHSIMVILPPPPMESAGGVARALIPIIYAAPKPVVIALMGERMIQEAVEYFRAARVPEYRFPERAASALAVLTERAEKMRADDGEPARLTFTDVRPEDARRVLDGYQAGAGDTADFLPFEIVSDMLAAYSIPVPRAMLATSADEAVDLAWQVGFPVALKVASPDIIHKTEAGGVLLNLTGPDEVEEGFATVTANARAAAPEARLDGVHVQRMVTSGQEVIIGALQDPQFAAIVMFGSGGVEVEGLRDVEFALAPLTKGDASGLLERTWAGRRLAGFRNLPPADREAVLEIIRRLGQMAADFPEIAEIELNPVRVLPEGQGAFAVDVRARLITNDE
jgi:acetyltransferase